MSGSVITNKKAAEHIIESYRFKVLATGDSKNQDNEQGEPEQAVENNQPSPPPPPQKVENFEPQEPPVNPQIQSSFVEELLKKTDELSGNIIKLQMKIESQENEFEKRLNDELERAKEISKKEGFEEAKADFDKQIEEIKVKYNRSLVLLDEERGKISEFLESTEKELPNAAIEVAKEVIKKEIKENSSKVALALAKELIKELEEATNLEVKINPADYEFVKESLENLKNVEFTADDAIALGGVVILSDVGNLDGNLSVRLEKMKHVLES